MNWKKGNKITKTKQSWKELETQIYELEKGHQNNENKTKLVRLKEMLSKEKKNRIFNLEPEQFSPEVNVKHHHTSTRKQKLCCKMYQIPANSNDATTGHKLQGMSKDIIIVSSWPTGGLSLMFKNWEYVVLSRVRTLSGLYLVEPIEGQIIQPITSTQIVHGESHAKRKGNT